MTARAPARPAAAAPVPGTGRDTFARLLLAEWTKFRTVRGWVAGLMVAALITVAFGLLVASGSRTECAGPGGQACPALPTGPDGEAVTASYTFAHRPLAGPGSITVRVSALTGRLLPDGGPGAPAGPAAGGTGRGSNGGAGLATGAPQPWAKAGVIITASTRPGAAYAAVLVTGGHGVRMQDDYTHDMPGLPGHVTPAAPRWLRLTRAGGTLTGWDSADGRHWARIGTAVLPGLPAVVQAGLFVTSPAQVQASSSSAGRSTSHVSATEATGVLGQVRLAGQWPRATWAHTAVGGPGRASPGGFARSGGRFTLTGSGDIAPRTDGPTVQGTLTGALAGLIAVAIVAALFVTAEYRRGLIRTTLAASPRRGRVLAAKAVVIGAVTFATGLAGAAAALLIGTPLLRHGNPGQLLTVPPLTELRMVAGTAALLAVAALLALALGTVLRRGVLAATAAVAVLVLPFLLAVSGVLPSGPSGWLLRASPAAAFAVQSAIPHYPQVSQACLPGSGCYPLPPWAGLAVLCGWAAAALLLAAIVLGRRDA